MDEKQLSQCNIIDIKQSIIYDNLLTKIKILLIIISLVITIILLLSDLYYSYNKLDSTQNPTKKKHKKVYDNNINFDFINYEKNIITNKIISNAEWQLSLEDAYFINGIIRKYKPKKCLEIGVANGGSSILILNAIKDIDNSFLISIDLNTQMYLKNELKTGYRVKKYFPELTKKWRLFTGDLPHKFLVK